MEVEVLNASVNVLAVLLAGVLAMVVGAVYYNPKVMGNTWMKLVGLKEEDVKDSTAMRSFGIAFVTLLVSFFFIGWLSSYVIQLNDYSDLVSGMIAAGVAWVFAAMTY